MFCKVYLQCGIIIQRLVTIHGLPSVQLSQMMNLKIEFAKNKCLSTRISSDKAGYLSKRDVRFILLK